MRITVFTPTYNRAYIISELYQSLCQQTFHDFEWVVVDDGSVDDTKNLFEQFMAESTFPIIYKKVENGGKHRAINQGIELSTGELFFIVDSDDHLPPDSLEIVDRIESTIPELEKEHYCGISGQKGKNADCAWGSTFSGSEYLDITNLERQIYRIDGDKAEVFYTSVLRKYPFPSFEGENFITECVVWDKMAEDGYLLRFFNEVIYYCDYFPDGLTAQGMRAFINNPKGWALFLGMSKKNGRFRGVRLWNEILQYYYHCREKISLHEMAEDLNIPSFQLFLRLLGIRLFYKFYDD